MANINVAGIIPVKGDPMPEVVQVYLRGGSTVYKGQILRKKMTASGISYALMSSGNTMSEFETVVCCEYKTARSTQGDVQAYAWRMDTNQDVVWEASQHKGSAGPYYVTTIQEQIGRRMDVAESATAFYITAASKNDVRVYDLRPGQTGTGPKKLLVQFTPSATDSIGT